MGRALMPHLPGVAEALADYGFEPNVDLIFNDGWVTHGSSSFNPRGSVNHHTAGARLGVLPSLEILVNGREGLPGPLCNHALDRLNRVWCIAAGRANHAGSGGWDGLSGNSSVWGLEVEHVGTTAEPVTDEKWDAMYRYHAAVGDFSGFSSGLTCQHFEWAPTRKIDFVKTYTNPVAFRNEVASRLPSGLPLPIISPEDLMPYPVVRSGSGSAQRPNTALLEGYVVKFAPLPLDVGPQEIWRPSYEYHAGVKAGLYKEVFSTDDTTYDRAVAAAKSLEKPS